MNGRKSKERNRDERRRKALYRLRNAGHDDTRWSYLVGWAADDESVPETRKTTHDWLIRQMGDTRDGPVRWDQWSGQEALDVITDLKRTANVQTIAYLTRIRRKVQEYGGFVIMASAPTKPV